MVYLIILILLLFGIYRYDYRNARSGRLIYWIALCFIFACVAGLRYKLGQDTITYINEYNTLRPITRINAEDFERTRFAPGFVVITSVFKQFTGEFTFFQFFHSVIVNGVIFYFFYKHCRHIFFAALVYFFYLYFLLCFQQMREAFAVCIFLLAWPAFRDGRWLWWYVASLFAFMFHISALIMFFLPLISIPGLRQLFIFGGRTWFVCLGIAVLGAAVQAIFFRYIELIAFSASMLEGIETYKNNSLGGSLLNFNGIIGTFFQYILYPLLALYFLQQRKKDNGRDFMRFDKFNAFVLMSVYVTIFSISVTIIARFNNYFFPFAILALSDWIFGYLKMKRDRLRLRLVYWVIIFLPMFCFHISGTYFNNMNRSGTLKTYMVYYPYTSVFDKDMDKKTERAINYIRRRII